MIMQKYLSMPSCDDTKISGDGSFYDFDPGLSKRPTTVLLLGHMKLLTIFKGLFQDIGAIPDTNEQHMSCNQVFEMTQGSTINNYYLGLTKIIKVTAVQCISH